MHILYETSVYNVKSMSLQDAALHFLEDLWAAEEAYEDSLQDEGQAPGGRTGTLAGSALLSSPSQPAASTSGRPPLGVSARNNKTGGSRLVERVRSSRKVAADVGAFAFFLYYCASYFSEHAYGYTPYLTLPPSMHEHNILPPTIYSPLPKTTPHPHPHSAPTQHIIILSHLLRSSHPYPHPHPHPPTHRRRPHQTASRRRHRRSPLQDRGATRPRGAARHPTSPQPHRRGPPVRPPRPTHRPTRTDRAPKRGGASAGAPARRRAESAGGRSDQGEADRGATAVRGASAAGGGVDVGAAAAGKCGAGTVGGGGQGGARPNGVWVWGFFYIFLHFFYLVFLSELFVHITIKYA